MSIKINYFWQLEFGEIRTYVDYWQILFGGLALKNRNETKNSLHMTAYSGKLPAPPYPFRDKYIPVEVAHMPPLFSAMWKKFLENNTIVIYIINFFGNNRWVCSDDNLGSVTIRFAT